MTYIVPKKNTIKMESRMRWKSPVRFGSGENSEISLPIGELPIDIEKAVNLNADFVNWLMSERKVAKKAQFAAHDAGDFIRESFYEMLE